MKTPWSRWCIAWIMPAMLLGSVCGTLAQTKSEEPAKSPAAKGAPAPKAAPDAKPALPAKPAPAEKAAPAPETAPAAKTEPAAKQPVAPAPAAPRALAPPGPYRRLAPGVMRTVDPRRQPLEAVSRHDVVELLAVDASYDFAKDVEFRRDIWALDFKFKPMRMIYVDIPQPSGQMQRKLIWYLVYSVTNPGKVMRPTMEQDGSYRLEPVDEPIRFAPGFLLEAVGLNKSYPDRVIPIAMAPIRLREDPNRQFYNTVEMQGRTLKPGEAVWGVATWEDVDPKTNRFSVYVKGLTNAYQWIDEPGRFKKGEPLGTGRHLLTKTLQLNFRRTGDEFEVKESQVHYGIPDGVDYQWVYR